MARPQIARQSRSPYEIPLPPLEEPLQIMAKLDAEAAQIEAVRSPLPRFEAKIKRVLGRVWGNGAEVEK